MRLIHVENLLMLDVVLKFRIEKVGKSYNWVMFRLLELVQPRRCRNATMSMGV